MNGLDPSAVTGVDIRVNPRWLTVCDIKQPRTGLEAKFSYTVVTAMTLHGVDTAFDAFYTDVVCRDPSLTAFWRKVVVTGDEAIGDTAASAGSNAAARQRSRRGSTSPSGCRPMRWSGACATKRPRSSAATRPTLCGWRSRGSSRCRRRALRVI
jgi:2-methylcitrate dehydratase PrpD